MPPRPRRMRMLFGSAGPKPSARRAMPRRPGSGECTMATGLRTTGVSDDRPHKRSLTLQGHQTSVSLETAFWNEFRRLAAARNLSVNALAAKLDAGRTPPASLASAIRLFVLAEVKAGR